MVKHRRHAEYCEICEKPLVKASKSKLKICYICKDDADNLPEHYLCKGITRSGKRCKRVLQEDYCTIHKNQKGDNND